MHPSPARSIATSLMMVAAVLAAASATSTPALAEPYCELVPRAPLTGQPYPGGVYIDGSHVNTPETAGYLWFDVYAGGWGPDYLRYLQTVLRTSELTSIGFPQVPCDGDPAPCVEAFGEGAECSDEGSWCNAALVDPVRIAETQELLGSQFFGNPYYEVPGGNASVSLANGTNQAGPDPGVPVYVATIVFEVVDKGEDAIEFWPEFSVAVLADKPVFNQSFNVDFAELSGASVEVRGLPDSNPNKSRFVTIPTDGLGVGALRVRGVDIAGHADFNGEERWVGAPYEYPLTRNPLPTAFAAETQCQQRVQDWSGLGDLDIGGRFIQPGRGNEFRSTYEVEFLSEACLDGTGPCNGPIYQVETAYFGDLAYPLETGDPRFSQPNIVDVTTGVHTYLGNPQRATKTHALLVDDRPGVTDARRDVDINDILHIVDAFLGSPYPHAGPQACP